MFARCGVENMAVFVCMKMKKRIYFAPYEKRHAFPAMIYNGGVGHGISRLFDKGFLLGSLVIGRPRVPTQ